MATHQAKADSFQLTDIEADRLNELAEPFIASVQREFGPWLAHAIALAKEDGFYIVDCINEWSTSSPITKAGRHSR